MIAIRKLTEDDASALRTIRLRALKENPADFSAAYEDVEPKPPEHWVQSIRGVSWYFALDGAAPVGCALLNVHSGAKLAHNGWVHGVYVAAEARGMGAADALMEAIEAEARGRGLAILKLLVRAGNRPAERLYARCGYTPYGREPASHKVDGIVYDSIELAKRLD